MNLPFKRGTLFKERVHSLRKEFAPLGANSFFKELTLIGKGGKSENGRVVSPKSVPIHLKQSLGYRIILTSKISAMIAQFRHKATSPINIKT